MDRDEVEVTSRAQWRAWLAENHDRSPGIWLISWKKASGDRHVPYDDLVEEALCFGWVDSQARGIDAERSSITMTPRRPRSGWSKPNRDRIARLEAADLMHPVGAAAVATAKEDGSWELLMAIEQLIEPGPLASALAADPAARRGWELQPPSARKAVLQQLLAVKREETMVRRVAAIITEARARIASADPTAERPADPSAGAPVDPPVDPLSDSPAARRVPVADSGG